MHSKKNTTAVTVCSAVKKSDNGHGGHGSQQQSDAETLTTSSGHPVADNQNSVTAGRGGPLLLAEDFHLYEKHARFNRERVPPRVVHEQGTGAFGTFTVTNDITKFTKAKLFEEIGKETEIFARWSTVSGEHGSADSIRDPRGFAVRFYTEEGNWDLVGNNTPIFFIRDPLKFPDLIHSQKRDGRGFKSWTMRWDFWALSPEATHQVLWLMGDRGLPASYRHLNGYGGHTFSMINANNERVWVKFHYKTQQGIKNMTDAEAMEMAGKDPDASAHDLFNAINEGSFPQWKLYIQTMTEAEAASQSFDPFDITKTWPHANFPLTEVGVLEFNRNPTNYFAEVEQAAFSPSSVAPGISFSPDRMLQARLFAYKDTAYHRLGVNHELLPVNRPRCPVRTYHIDGLMRFDDNNNLKPTYEPNSFGGLKENPAYPSPPLPVAVDGPGQRYNHQQGNDNFLQASYLYSLMKDDERQRVITNIINTLTQGMGAGVKSEPVPPGIQKLVVYNFSRVNEELGRQLAQKLGFKVNECEESARSKLQENAYSGSK